MIDRRKVSSVWTLAKILIAVGRDFKGKPFKWRLVKSENRITSSSSNLCEVELRRRSQQRYATIGI